MIYPNRQAECEVKFDNVRYEFPAKIVGMCVVHDVKARYRKGTDLR